MSDTEAKLDETKTLSKRKRKAQESWATKKSDKKSKVEKEEDPDATINPLTGDAKKSKKKKEDDRKKTDASTSTEAEADADAKHKKKRFILFLGNLSYQTTVEDIEAHIKPTGVKPIAIRLQTDAATKKPKGFAFLDLPDFMSLDRVLNLHHTSMGGRKINVELTAGGGGSGEKRKAKINKKNEKLDVERETAQKSKRDADAKKARDNAGQKEEKAADMGDINPARRRRIK